MLVNYYYVCIRTHDSKPWRQVIGIRLKENEKKKPAGKRVSFFFWRGRTAGAKANLSLTPLQALLAHGFIQRTLAIENTS